MRILSIETSCDETSAAVVEQISDDPFVKVLSNVTATSLAIHAKTGGIIPENAAREQAKYIIPVINKALQLSVFSSQFSDSSLSVISQSVLTDKQKTGKLETENRNLTTDNRSAQDILREDIDAIAVTYGPGLIGSLLIGVETAKTLSFAFNKPIIPVNHLLAHLFANFIVGSKIKDQRSKIQFPFIGLIVSGGHTDLLLFESITKYKWLGGTRDDAAGEALDKIGRLINLPYPAGPEIERRSLLVSDRHKSPSLKGEGPTGGEGERIRFKSPMLNSKDFDFSFSGLKAEASRFIQAQNDNKHLTEGLTDQICSAVQQAIFDVLIKKTIQAAQKHSCSTILLGGGVSANETLLQEFKTRIVNKESRIMVFAPEKQYSTDNAAMIGAYAALRPITKNWKEVSSQPDLYFA